MEQVTDGPFKKILRRINSARVLEMHFHYENYHMGEFCGFFLLWNKAVRCLGSAIITGFPFQSPEIPNQSWKSEHFFTKSFHDSPSTIHHVVSSAPSSYLAKFLNELKTSGNVLGTRRTWITWLCQKAVGMWWPSLWPKGVKKSLREGKPSSVRVDGRHHGPKPERDISTNNFLPSSLSLTVFQLALSFGSSRVQLLSFVA